MRDCFEPLSTIDSRFQYSVLPCHLLSHATTPTTVRPFSTHPLGRPRRSGRPPDGSAIHHGVRPAARRALARINPLMKGGIAGVLVLEPSVVVLDEPLAGLDPERSRLVADRIRQIHADGISVVLSTHVLEFAAEVADHVCLIADGNVVGSGTPGVLRRRAVEGRESSPTESGSRGSRCRTRGVGTAGDRGRPRVACP